MPAATLARVDEMSAAAVDRAASTFLSTVSSATCEQATITHTIGDLCRVYTDCCDPGGCG